MKNQNWFKINGYAQSNIGGLAIASYFLADGLSHNDLALIILSCIFIPMNIFFISIILSMRHDELKTALLEKEAFSL